MARYFATASRGTEAVLAAELKALRIGGVTEGRGGVTFGKALEEAYRACLWSRIASRVLLPLTELTAPDADSLYEGVHGIDWNEHLGPKQTLAVDVAGKDAAAGPGHFIALKTKDAIVDRIREVHGRRPSVDTERPDLRVNLHVRKDRVTVNLDLSGRGMHRRGVGREGAEAPLKENLAAAILHLAGWPAAAQERPLFDPLCGSGTLLIEAAWIALDVAPGLMRRRIGAEGWLGHDAALWRRLRKEAEERLQAAGSRKPRIAGADASDAAVQTARDNLRRAGLERRIDVARGELRHAQPPWREPGLLVTNPPYGERLGESNELLPLYELLGDVLKRRFAGWNAWVFTGNPALGKRIGLRPASRQLLWNGPIESRLLEIPISAAPVAGGDGPGWRKPSGQAKALGTRLKKNLAQLRPWAEQEGVTCYRLYDADVPEYNLAIDWYDGTVRVEEYPRPKKVDAAAAERRLRDALLVAPELLGVEPEKVVLSVGGKQQSGAHGRVVAEGDLRFEVNLEDQRDTGLRLDERLLRRYVREQARDRRFLHLFAGSCTAALAAAAGGARSTTSVDPSESRLALGRRNFELNRIGGDRHRFECADGMPWLRRARRDRRFDLILLQQDHLELVESTTRLLAPGGELLFATRRRGFEPEFREITGEITPLDFERRSGLRVWSLRLR
jgi:23S rRNA (guanine2445-N2)-methyltransferase / 23S rRNA (guanine2069-N7)-methyltransferase